MLSHKPINDADSEIVPNSKQQQPTKTIKPSMLIVHQATSEHHKSTEYYKIFRNDKEVEVRGRSKIKWLIIHHLPLS